MASPDKAAAVAELADNFREASGAVLTDYRGLTVSELQELRRALGEDASYSVAKNTLTKIAARDAGVELDEALLVGPTAIAFITGDAVNAAKGLKNFAKDHDALVIKGGFLDGKVLSTDEIKKLADLESREVLLAKLAGGMKASLSNAASLFNAPLSQAARVVGALQAKAESDPTVLAGGAGAPAVEENTTETEAEAPAEADVEAKTDEATEAPSEVADEAAESTDAGSTESATDTEG